MNCPWDADRGANISDKASAEVWDKYVGSKVNVLHLITIDTNIRHVFYSGIP
jgi:hypothetical protein